MEVVTQTPPAMKSAKRTETKLPATEETDSDIEADWCFVSLYGTVENEHITEREDIRQVTHNVANCISKELLCSPEDELMAETVDEIFKTFEIVADVEVEPLIQFWTVWRNQEYERHQIHRKRTSVSTLCSVTSEHVNNDIIIALMVDLLRVSPEPEKIHLLWLKILTHFLLESGTSGESLEVLLNLKVAATILGTMSAYRRSAEIQKYGCSALAVFAPVRPTPRRKAPLRESAIQVLAESLMNHKDNFDVVRDACGIIAVVAEVMVHLPSYCIEQGYTSEETEHLCQSANDILDCIRLAVMDRLENISGRYSGAEEIQASVTKLLACFGCHSSNRRSSEPVDVFRPKSHTTPVTLKRVYFAGELEVIPGSPPSCTLSLNRGETFHSLRSELEAEEERHEATTKDSIPDQEQDGDSPTVSGDEDNGGVDDTSPEVSTTYKNLSFEDGKVIVAEQSSDHQEHSQPQESTTRDVQFIPSGEVQSYSEGEPIPQEELPKCYQGEQTPCEEGEMTLKGQYGEYGTEHVREYSYLRYDGQGAVAVGGELPPLEGELDSFEEPQIFLEDVRESPEEELSSAEEQGSSHLDQQTTYEEQQIPYGEQQMPPDEEQQDVYDEQSLHDYENVELSQIREQLRSLEVRQSSAHRDFTEEELRALYDEEALYENAQEIREKLYHLEGLEQGVAESGYFQSASEEDQYPVPQQEPVIFDKDGQVLRGHLDHAEESQLLPSGRGSFESPDSTYLENQEDQFESHHDGQVVQGDEFAGYHEELIDQENRFQGYHENQAAFGDEAEVPMEDQYQSGESDQFPQRQQLVSDSYPFLESQQEHLHDFHEEQVVFNENGPVLGESHDELHDEYQSMEDHNLIIRNPPEPLQVFYEQKALFDENIHLLSQNQYSTDGHQPRTDGEPFDGQRLDCGCGGDAKGELVEEFYEDQLRGEETHYSEDSRESSYPGEYYNSREDGVEGYCEEIGYSEPDSSMEFSEENFQDPNGNESSEVHGETDGSLYRGHLRQDPLETEWNAEYLSDDVRYSGSRSCDEFDCGASLEGDSTDQQERSETIDQGEQHADEFHGESEERLQECRRESTGFMNQDSELSLQDVIDQAADDFTRRDDIEREIAEEYRVHSEFDIVDALVGAGLLTESVSCTETPRFPLEYTPEGGRGAGAHPSSNNLLGDSRCTCREAGENLDDTGFEEAGEEDVISSPSRVSSTYENVEELRGEARDVDGSRGWKGPRQQQTSFDSGLDDQYEPLGDSDCLLGEQVSEGTGEWGSCRRLEKRFIDECVRMSRLSILTEDMEDAMWHENEAFGSTIAPEAVRGSGISGMGASGSSLDMTSGEEHSVSDPEGCSAYHADMSRTESSASGRNSSYSSGSFVQQHSMLGECRSMGSLDKLCNPREAGSNDQGDNETDRNCIGAVKTMSCSHVSLVTPPPKPRRTWYYRSSQDVRRSLTRSAQPCYDVLDNPVYDEPPDLYSSVSKPKKYHRNEPTYAKVQKKHLRPSSSETSNGTSVSSNTLGVIKSAIASSIDSGVGLLSKEKGKKARKSSHLYEDVRLLDVNSRQKSEALSRYLEEDSSEATYEVCTLWVNGKYFEALETFNHLTQRLASLYSIVPEARKEENRRSALIDKPHDFEDNYPAWANILNVLASEVGKWTLSLMVKFLPIADRLFQVEDKNVLNAVIEVIKVLVERYGRDIQKNRNPSLFKTRFREDCRECFTWLGKLHLRTEFLLTKRREKESPNSLLHSSLLDSFAESLQPFSNNRKKSKHMQTKHWTFHHNL